MASPPTPPILVLGSVLRPIDDHRMYEKLGMALDETGRWQVHIIGHCSFSYVRHPSIRFHPMFCFPRMSVQRFVAPLHFLWKLFELKPEVVIVNSPDLQIVAIAYKILFGKKLIYDVLENYQANILFANTHPVFVRSLLARVVRLSEHMARPFITRYWLAERVYAREMPFVKHNHLVVENRASYPVDVRVKPRRGRHRLLFSGTLAASYGVFDAIELVRRLHVSDSRYHLTIIGYAAQKAVQEAVLACAGSCNFIDLEGITEWVPHSRISRVIQKCDVGLLPYRVNRAIEYRIPTKCYEYAGLGLPFVMSNAVYWQTVVGKSFPSAIFYDFDRLDPSDFSNVVQNSLPNTNIGIIDEAYYTNIFSNMGEFLY